MSWLWRSTRELMTQRPVDQLSMGRSFIQTSCRSTFHCMWRWPFQSTNPQLLSHPFSHRTHQLPLLGSKNGLGSEISGLSRVWRSWRHRKKSSSFSTPVQNKNAEDGHGHGDSGVLDARPVACGCSILSQIGYPKNGLFYYGKSLAVKTFGWDSKVLIPRYSQVLESL